MIQEAHPALAPERRDRIRILVREDGVVRVEDLRKNLNVSVATIRRDLEILEEEGKVKRVHGGAVSMESRFSGLSDKLGPTWVAAIGCSQGRTTLGSTPAP